MSDIVHLALVLGLLSASAAYVRGLARILDRDEESQGGR